MRVRFHSLAALVAALTVVPSAARAQGILNTERFQLDDVSGFHTSVDFSLSGAAGNADYLDASASGILGFRSERHWLRLIGGGKFLADDERRVLDDRFAQLRYSYAVSSALETFYFLQVQANRSLLLENRWLAGGGIRFPVARSERTQLHLGTGIMYEEERRDREQIGPADEPQLSTVRVANHVVVRHELPGGAKLLDILYFQPSATSISNVRLLNDLGLEVPLSDHVSFSAAVEWRHDSRPPASLETDDVRFRTGVTIDLN